MSDKLLDGLKKLDTRNDNHWTAEKLPRVETVRLLAADQTITREDIDSAAAGFTRDTAAAYWLSTPAAATGPAGADDSEGQGVSGSPHSQGAGAAPQAETQKVEGANAAGDSGDGTTPASASEQPALESDGSVDGKDDFASLEAELEATKAAIAEKRLMIDQTKDEMDVLIRREAELDDALRSTRSARSDNANAIQAYLASQRKSLAERAARKTLIAESGIDLKELTQNLQSPLDAAMARRTGRGGQRPAR